MQNTLSRIRNPETIRRLGGRLRQQRERAKLAQGKVSGMRQATVSKIENGGDVTLDSFVSYAAALGLEITLVPIGQASKHEASVAGHPQTKPLDLLAQFDDLKDAP
ncbi:MAG: helix-turn-helix transcriptional regulator [Pseudomonadota bacterium]